jgi:hypothetical protein
MKGIEFLDLFGTLGLKYWGLALLVRGDLFTVLPDVGDVVAEETTEFLTVLTIVDAVVTVHVGHADTAARDSIDVLVHGCCVFVFEGNQG